MNECCSTCGRALLWAGGRLICPRPGCPGHTCGASPRTRSVTDMHSEYRKHREQGHGHHAALKALARRFGFDPGTVARVVDRAQRDDATNRAEAA